MYTLMYTTAWALDKSWASSFSRHSRACFFSASVASAMVRLVLNNNS